MFNDNVASDINSSIPFSHHNSNTMDASLQKFQSSLSRIYDKYDRPFLDCETEVVDLATLTILKGSSKRGIKGTGIIAGIQEDRELGEEILVDPKAMEHSEQYQPESGGSDSDLTDLETENSTSSTLLNKMRNIKKILLKSKDQSLSLKSELPRGHAANQQDRNLQLGSHQSQATFQVEEERIPMIRIKRPRQKHKVEPPRPRGRPRKVLDPSLPPPPPKKSRRRRRRAKELDQSLTLASIQPSPSKPFSVQRTSPTSIPAAKACMMTPEPSSCSSEHFSSGLPPILLAIVKEDPILLSLYHSLLSSPHYKELTQLYK